MRAALQESAMLIMVARRGKTECTDACPFYEASGRIACFGGPKASHCRMIMKPYFVDCNHYDITTLRVLEMPEDSSETAIAQRIAQAPEKMRKLYKTNRKPVFKPINNE